MDRGDGAYDVFPDFWMPNRAPAWKEYIDQRQTIRHNKPYQAEQGFYTSAQIASRLGLKHISDLKSASVAALFDSDGNGLGEYWAGEKTWSATILNQIKMKSYGLDELWEPWIAKNHTFKDKFVRAIETETPILFYHWNPEWIFGAHSLTRITEPVYEEGCVSTWKPEQREDWLEASDFSCAFETSHVYVIYSASLESRA